MSPCSISYPVRPIIVAFCVLGIVLVLKGQYKLIVGKSSIIDPLACAFSSHRTTAPFSSPAIVILPPESFKQRTHNFQSHGMDLISYEKYFPRFGCRSNGIARVNLSEPLYVQPSLDTFLNVAVVLLSIYCSVPRLGLRKQTYLQKDLATWTSPAPMNDKILAQSPSWSLFSGEG